MSFQEVMNRLAMEHFLLIYVVPSPTPIQGFLSTQVEARVGTHRVKQLASQRGCIIVPRQLEKIHTSACAGQPRLIATAISNAESWTQLREAEQRGARRR